VMMVLNLRISKQQNFPEPYDSWEKCYNIITECDISVKLCVFNEIPQKWVLTNLYMV
jgi:hypothetical protein